MVIVDMLGGTKYNLWKAYQDAEKAGKLKEFRLQGFPRFSYMVSYDPFVMRMFGCSFNPIKSNITRKEGENRVLIFIPATLPKDFAKIMAFHEFIEGNGKTHQQAVKKEIDVARKLGIEAKWREVRKGIARKHFRAGYKPEKLQTSRERLKEYREVAGWIARNHGLTMSELQRNTSNIVQWKKMQRRANRVKVK